MPREKYCEEKFKDRADGIFPDAESDSLMWTRWRRRIDEPAQLLRARGDRADALVLDQRGRHIAQDRLLVLRVDAEASALRGERPAGRGLPRRQRGRERPQGQRRDERAEHAGGEAVAGE